jgi:hypothetical protein
MSAALSVGKGAQLNLALSLEREREGTPVHVGVVTLCGPIKVGTAYDPDRLANVYWELTTRESTASNGTASSRRPTDPRWASSRGLDTQGRPVLIESESEAQHCDRRCHERHLTPDRCRRSTAVRPHAVTTSTSTDGFVVASWAREWQTALRPTTWDGAVRLERPRTEPPLHGLDGATPAAAHRDRWSRWTCTAG